MSAIAHVNIVSAEKLDGYLRSGGSWEAVLAGSDALSYKWSGYVFGTLLPYLDEQGISLSDARCAPLSEAREASCVLLTTDHRRFVDQLDATRFDGGKLRAYFEAFNETSAEGVERAMLDGIRLLRDVITRVSEGTIGLIVIG